jgi:hypothetical protein
MGVFSLIFIPLTSSTFLGYEVLSAVAMKSQVFWNIKQTSSVKLERSFEEHIVSIFRVEYKSSKKSAGNKK